MFKAIFGSESPRKFRVSAALGLSGLHAPEEILEFKMVILNEILADHAN